VYDANDKMAEKLSRIITEKEWYIIPFGRKLAGLQLAINSKKKGEKR
jgi:PST family polysaccharide transporter